MICRASLAALFIFAAFANAQTEVALRERDADQILYPSDIPNREDSVSDLDGPSQRGPEDSVSEGAAPSLASDLQQDLMDLADLDTDLADYDDLLLSSSSEQLESEGIESETEEGGVLPQKPSRSLGAKVGLAILGIAAAAALAWAPVVVFKVEYDRKRLCKKRGPSTLPDQKAPIAPAVIQPSTGAATPSSSTTPMAQKPQDKSASPSANATPSKPKSEPSPTKPPAPSVTTRADTSKPTQAASHTPTSSTSTSKPTEKVDVSKPQSQGDSGSAVQPSKPAVRPLEDEGAKSDEAEKERTDSESEEGKALYQPPEAKDIPHDQVRPVPVHHTAPPLTANLTPNQLASAILPELLELVEAGDDAAIRRHWIYDQAVRPVLQGRESITPADGQALVQPITSAIVAYIASAAYPDLPPALVELLQSKIEYQQEGRTHCVQWAKHVYRFGLEGDLSAVAVHSVILTAHLMRVYAAFGEQSKRVALALAQQLSKAQNLNVADDPTFEASLLSTWADSWKQTSIDMAKGPCRPYAKVGTPSSEESAVIVAFDKALQQNQQYLKLGTKPKKISASGSSIQQMQPLSDLAHAIANKYHAIQQRMANEEAKEKAKLDKEKAKRADKAATQGGNRP